MTRLVQSEESAIRVNIAAMSDVPDPSLEGRYIRRCIVLKNPVRRGEVLERGVLLITFTETFPYFHEKINCEELLNYFYVVLEPSWAGYCDANILRWSTYSGRPIVVEATESTDFEFISALGSNLVPVSFGASDWADFRTFAPVAGVEKRYDAVYVTNYHPIKRHHVFFKAIRAISDPTYKAAIVFGRNGDAEDDIQALIDFYGIRKNLEIFEGLPQQELNKLLNMSKVNVLFSLKEGSNRSLFESMFSGVPGILLKSNVGANKTYINSYTGRLVEEREVCEALQHFRTEWSTYSPREWALQNISPLVTTQKLSKILRGCAEEQGEPWTQDLVPKVNAPEVQYFHDADTKRMLASREVLACFRKDQQRSRSSAAVEAQLLKTNQD
ncbi:MAG: glycosyltransferase [Nitrospiraceae bacterium]